MANAPSTAPYLLQTPDPTDLPESRVLSADTFNDDISVITIGTEVVISATDNLQAVFQLSQNGYFCQNSGAQGFRGLSFTSAQTMGITNPSGQAGNTRFNVTNDTNIQRVNYLQSGVLQATRSTLDMESTTPLTLSIVDNPTLNRADITLSAQSEQGGTVSSVNLASTSGFTISGDQPVVSRGIINIDLPAATSSDVGKFLTITGISPQVIGWETDPITGTLFSVTINSTNAVQNGMPWFTISGNTVTTAGSVSIALNQWSLVPATTDFTLNTSVSTPYLLTCGSMNFQNSNTQSSTPVTMKSLNQRGVNNLPVQFLTTVSSSLSPFEGYFVGVTGANFPSSLTDTEAFAYQGSMFYGNLVPGLDVATPQWNVINPPSSGGTYYLDALSSFGIAPLWTPSAAFQEGNTMLSSTSVAATGGETFIILGDGTCFIPYDLMTEDTVVHVTAVGIYNGNRPSIGPLTVRIKGTTDHNELPKGFVIYGDGVNDNGKSLVYAIVGTGTEN